MWWLIFTALFQLYIPGTKYAVSSNNQCVRTEFSRKFVLLPLIGQKKEEKQKKRGPPFGKFSLAMRKTSGPFWPRGCGSRVGSTTAPVLSSLTKKRFLGCKTVQYSGTDRPTDRPTHGRPVRTRCYVVIITGSAGVFHGLLLLLWSFTISSKIIIVSCPLHGLGARISTRRGTFSAFCLLEPKVGVGQTSIKNDEHCE